MAAELDIKRCWFHNTHYDIPKRRIAEIEAKCQLVSSKEIVRIIKMSNTEPRMIHEQFIIDLYFSDYDNAPISVLVGKLQQEEQDALEKGYSNIRLDCAYTDGYINIVGSRLETEEEVKERIKRETLAAKKLADKEKEEYELYLKLHEKYGDDYAF